MINFEHQPRRMRWLSGFGAALALVLSASAAFAAPPAEVHGSLDAYAAPGVALVWGVLRGAGEGVATVVVRVDAEAKRYRTLTVSGVDPFTKASQVLFGPTAIDGTLQVRLPRSRFADLPRTEWRFYAADPAALKSTDPPTLLVYYQGVPDTTPEFENEAGLDTSLAQRIERLKSGR